MFILIVSKPCTLLFVVSVVEVEDDVVVVDSGELHSKLGVVKNPKSWILN